MKFLVLTFVLSSENNPGLLQLDDGRLEYFCREGGFVLGGPSDELPEDHYLDRPEVGVVSAGSGGAGGKALVLMFPVTEETSPQLAALDDDRLEYFSREGYFMLGGSHRPDDDVLTRPQVTVAPAN